MMGNANYNRNNLRTRKFSDGGGMLPDSPRSIGMIEH